MDNSIYIIIAVVVAVFVVMMIWQQRRFKELKDRGQVDENLKSWIEGTKKDMDTLRHEVRGGLDKNTETMQRQLGVTNQAINERLDKAAMFMKTIGQEVGQMRELGKSMKDLQDFLQSPKLRGNIGEEILKDLLNQVLPTSNFSVQYKFKEGQTVDAIIKTDNGLIPVDSKFPMENARKLFQTENEKDKATVKNEFAKDVRKHIGDISRKYILPSEGTVDFAIMYVPSEAVYYEVVANCQEVIDYGQSKKVFLVSPNSFYYFLQAIMLGLRGKKIEEKAKQIMDTLGTIQQESVKFGESLGVLDRHLTNAKNAMEGVTSKYSKLSGKIDSVKMLK